MGMVFQARDLASGERVAVKVLLHDSPLAAARFARETRILAEFSHPGIVRHIDHGITSSGQHYLVMEWLEGEDLRARLKRGGLTLAESIELATQVASALAAAHARGVVHRDLKPSNLFLVGDRIDQVKLIDFGLARFDEATIMTQEGALMGTPSYMAPEQARGAIELDGRVDVFALGCVLFECLTGERAFSGQQVMATLAKILYCRAAIHTRIAAGDSPRDRRSGRVDAGQASRPAAARRRRAIQCPRRARADALCEYGGGERGSSVRESADGLGEALDLRDLDRRGYFFSPGGTG